MSINYTFPHFMGRNFPYTENQLVTFNPLILSHIRNPLTQVFLLFPQYKLEIKPLISTTDIPTKHVAYLPVR